MESIERVNEMLQDGNSMAKVEKLLGYGKDTLRKKLNRNGYKFNKETKQYEFTGDNTNQVEQKKIPKDGIVQLVTDSYAPKVKPKESNGPFKDNEIDILHRMIKEYQLKEKLSVMADDKGELGNRNVRVYVNHFNSFSNWCKRNGVTQADALYEAINLLIKTNE